MEWTRKKTKTVVASIKILLIVLVAIGVVFCFGRWIFKIFGIGLLLGIVFGFILPRLKNIPEEQRWLVEVFGGYYRTLKSGLHWIFPFVEKVRTFISVWEQRYRLFEKPIKIDFIDGSAAPKDAFVFVQCNEKEDPDAPYKMVYEIKNIEEATIALIENAVRSYLNSKKIDEALQEGRGGYNILDKMPEDDVNGVTEKLKNWGLKLHRITIADFDLDETVVKAREGIIMAESELKAVQHQKRIIAERSIGVLIEQEAIFQGVKPSTIKRKIRKDVGKQKKYLKFGKDYDLRQQAADNKSLTHTHVEVSGAGGLEKMGLNFISAVASLFQSKKETKNSSS